MLSYICIKRVLTNICDAQNRLCSALSTASSVNGPGRWIRSPPPPPSSTVDPLPPPPGTLPAAEAAAAGPCDDRLRCACCRLLFVSVFCCVTDGDVVAFAHLLPAWPPFSDSSFPLNSLSAREKKNYNYNVVITTTCLKYNYDSYSNMFLNCSDHSFVFLSIRFFR